MKSAELKTLAGIGVSSLIYAKKHWNECKWMQKTFFFASGFLNIWAKPRPHLQTMDVDEGLANEINIMLLPSVAQATGKMSGRNELCKIIFCNICYAR